MEIKDRDDFLVFLRRFIDQTNAEDFENATLGDFLEGMHGWIEDMDGYYQNRGRPHDSAGETLRWSTLADILQAARYYE